MKSSKTLSLQEERLCHPHSMWYKSHVPVGREQVRAKDEEGSSAESCLWPQYSPSRWDSCSYCIVSYSFYFLLLFFSSSLLCSLLCCCSPCILPAVSGHSGSRQTRGVGFTPRSTIAPSSTLSPMRRAIQ